MSTEHRRFIEFMFVGGPDRDRVDLVTIQCRCGRLFTSAGIAAHLEQVAA